MEAPKQPLLPSGAETGSLERETYLLQGSTHYPSRCVTALTHLSII